MATLKSFEDDDNDDIVKFLVRARARINSSCGLLRLSGSMMVLTGIQTIGLYLHPDIRRVSRTSVGPNNQR